MPVRKRRRASLRRKDVPGDIKKGDEVITRSPLWHCGEDIGDRLGKVISTYGHILVQLYDYNGGPIKCFRNEIEPIKGRKKSTKEYIEIDLNKMLF